MSAVIGVALAKGFTQLSDFRIDDNGDVNWAVSRSLLEPNKLPSNELR